MPAFREATWEEALEHRRVERLKGIKRRPTGPNALAGFGSAKCSNEEAYLFQKLVRAVFGTNNVDHCTAACATRRSVAALLEMHRLRRGHHDVQRHASNAEVALADRHQRRRPTTRSPRRSSRRRGATSGTKLIVVDPRASGIADHAWRFCQINSGTDVAFYNAMMHVIIAEGLVDEDYIAKHTTDFEAVKRDGQEVHARDRERRSAASPADLIREVALAYGRAKAAITYWGMGMSQHVHGTDNCRCLISLCLMTGNIGRTAPACTRCAARTTCRARRTRA